VIARSFPTRLICGWTDFANLADRASGGCPTLRSVAGAVEVAVAAIRRVNVEESGPKSRDLPAASRCS
jgi:hypothetical protein